MSRCSGGNSSRTRSASSIASSLTPPPSLSSDVEQPQQFHHRNLSVSVLPVCFSNTNMKRASSGSTDLPNDDAKKRKTISKPLDGFFGVSPPAQPLLLGRSMWVGRLMVKNVYNCIGIPQTMLKGITLSPLEFARKRLSTSLYVIHFKHKASIRQRLDFLRFRRTLREHKRH